MIECGVETSGISDCVALIEWWSLGVLLVRPRQLRERALVASHESIVAARDFGRVVRSVIAAGVVLGRLAEQLSGTTGVKLGAVRPSLTAPRHAARLHVDTRQVV